MSTTRVAVLATVERSPAAAAAHDRGGWVGLFTGDGRVEDPVGSRPHIGRDRLERFYDTFIGPRDITFHRDVDIVAGSTVLRDLVLEVAMGCQGSAAVTMHIPAILRYDVRRDGDELRVAALRAYWELPAMAVAFARSGPAALPAGLALTGALLRNQGAAGAVGFMAGLPGVGSRGKKLVSEFLADAAAGDEVSVKRRLGAGLQVTAGDDAALSLVDLVALLAGTRVRTMLAAGRQVAVSVRGDDTDLVLIAEFGARASALRRLRVFVDEG
ncbi:ketosteroid isomerase family protein [Mycobacterium sp. BMJ-28]